MRTGCTGAAGNESTSRSGFPSPSTTVTEAPAAASTALRHRSSSPETTGERSTGAAVSRRPSSRTVTPSIPVSLPTFFASAARSEITAVGESLPSTVFRRPAAVTDGSAAASRVARASAAEAAFAGSRFTTVTVCQVMNGAFFRSTTGVVYGFSSA